MSLEHSSDQYVVNWDNHMSHVKKAFDTLFTGKEFVDVTLSCEGKKVTAHKVVLSACSSYFHDLFRDNPCQHPIVILKDVKYEILRDILKFVYNGEVNINSDDFDIFLKTAQLLQICGLTDYTQSQENEISFSSDTISHSTKKLPNIATKRKLDVQNDNITANKKQVTEGNKNVSSVTENQAQEVEFANVKKEVSEDIKSEVELEDPLHSDYMFETVDDEPELLESEGPSEYYIIILFFFEFELNLNNDVHYLSKVYYSKNINLMIAIKISV